MSKLHRLWFLFGLLALVLLIAACTATESEPVTQGDAAQGRSLWV